MSAARIRELEWELEARKVRALELSEAVDLLSADNLVLRQRVEELEAQAEQEVGDLPPDEQAA